MLPTSRYSNLISGVREFSGMGWYKVYIVGMTCKGQSMEDQKARYNLRLTENIPSHLPLGKCRVPTTATTQKTRIMDAEINPQPVRDNITNKAVIFAFFLLVEH